MKDWMFFLIAILWVIHTCTIIILKVWAHSDPTSFDVLSSLTMLIFLIKRELKPNP